jgi:hypothetical protein
MNAVNELFRRDERPFHPLSRHRRPVRLFRSRTWTRRLKSQLWDFLVGRREHLAEPAALLLRQRDIPYVYWSTAPYTSSGALRVRDSGPKTLMKPSDDAA